METSSLWTNVSAQRLTVVLAVLGGMTWIGGKLSDKPVTDSAYWIEFGLIIALVLVDHLHAIRQALERTAK